MNVSIFDLMDGYREDNIEISQKNTVSVERIKEKTLKRLELSENMAKPRPKRAARFAAIAVAAVLLLSVAALAVSGYSLGELPGGVRELFGIADESVPEYVVYDSIEIPQSAYYNCGREARGELYLTPGQTLRSENLLTQYFYAAYIDQKQSESYQWYWLLKDGKTCVPAKLDAELDSEAAVDWSRGLAAKELLTRAVFFVDADSDEGFEARLCAGHASEDGKSFSVERISAYYTILPEKAYPAVELKLDEPVEFFYGDGHVGHLTEIEISSQRLVATLEVPEITGLYAVTYGEAEHLTGEEWMSENAKLMSWMSDCSQFVGSMQLALSDGTTVTASELSLRSDSPPLPTDGDRCLATAKWDKSFDTTKLVSISLNGQEIPIK